MKTRTLRDEALFFERNPHRSARQGHLLPPLDLPELDPTSVLPAELLRDAAPGYPDIGETELVQHFHRLSQLNYAVDEGLYPLGSCTMKYNPRINERNARLAGFTDLHPLQPDEQIQGALAVRSCFGYRPHPCKNLKYCRLTAGEFVRFLVVSLLKRTIFLVQILRSREFLFQDFSRKREIPGSRIWFG